MSTSQTADQPIPICSGDRAGDSHQRLDTDSYTAQRLVCIFWLDTILNLNKAN